jgi:hypothetical protein
MVAAKGLSWRATSGFPRFQELKLRARRKATGSPSEAASYFFGSINKNIAFKKTAVSADAARSRLDYFCLDTQAGAWITTVCHFSLKR